MTFFKHSTTLLLIFFTFCTVSLIDLSFSADTAEARSRGGGRSFSRTRTTRTPSRQTTGTTPRRSGTSSFTKGLAGGFLGGALGSMLFGGSAMGGGGMGGVGGSGIGIFQILLFAGIGYFIYKRFIKRPATTSSYQQTGSNTGLFGNTMGSDQHGAPPPPPNQTAMPLSEEIKELQQSDPQFDPDHFKEIAQDVFFQVQAGWMRRDLESYRHLLGDQLAKEYEGHFAEMSQKGQINKLESIAIRKVEIVDAGVFGDFEVVTILFTANLLDYTVDEKSNELIEGDMTTPVKFAEKWSWGRPVGSDEWKLERIEVA